MLVRLNFSSNRVEIYHKLTVANSNATR